MKLNPDNYYDKVLGCWFGKNAGGTIGAPFEWRRQVNDVSFYPQKDLDGEPVPNDDLDIQLLWLIAMEELGFNVNAHRLSEYWCTFLTPHWLEYGISKLNMRQGLQPPLSGTFQNIMKNSNGAWIRSEIWACVAPGLPHIAARYAYEDSILDHGNGEGTYAAIFLAAMESAAFLVSDIKELVDIALTYVPKDCNLAKAVHTTLECHQRGMTWLEARDEVLRRHGGAPLGGPRTASEYDKKNGLVGSEPGMDAPANIGFMLIGLLWGGDDFGKVLCTAVNCGEDTDCTAASAGSIWGIIHGYNKLPQEWLKPIGRGIKALYLNVGELGHMGCQIPKTIDDLTERTIKLSRRLLLEQNVELGDLNPEKFKATDEGRAIWGECNGPRYDFDWFSVHVDYGEEGAVIRDGQSKELTIFIRNKYKHQANLALHWYLPPGWQATPADAYSMLYSWPHWLGGGLRFKFTLSAPQITQATNRAVLEFTIAGRPTVMLVPVVLINGSGLLPEGNAVPLSA